MGAQEQHGAVGDKSLHDTLEKLELSKEEVDKFEKAFKDPEFMRMFADYAKEISDPKNRQETDLYLRQLEAESRVEEVYGEGVQLIVPTEGFVVKTHEQVSGRKVFINICSSDKIEPCKGRKAADPSRPGKSGTSWDIPLSLGKPKTGTDKKGRACDVFDFVVHPNTQEMALRHAPFKSLIVETAIENIEKNFSQKLSRSWKQPKLSYKGVEGAETPHAMAVRSGEPSHQSVSGRIQPQPGAVKNELVNSVGDTAVSSEQLQAPEGSSSSFRFPSPKKRISEVKPSKPGDIGFKYPSGETCPEYQVIESGSLDLAAAWGDAGRGIDVAANIPKSLILRVRLPGCLSAAGMELDVQKTCVDLCIPGKYRLQKSISHGVDESRAKAKFDKSKQQLEIKLPVIPPAPASFFHEQQKLAKVSAVEDMNAAVDAIGSDGPCHGIGNSSSELIHTSTGRGTMDRKVESEAQSTPEESDCQNTVGLMLPDGNINDMNQVQAKWLELMRQHDAAVKNTDSAELQVAAGDEKRPEAFKDVGTSAFIPEPTWSGPRPGYVFKTGSSGIGYYKDGGCAQDQCSTALSETQRKSAALHSGAVAGVSSTVPSAPKVSLQPRIDSTFAEELD